MTSPDAMGSRMSSREDEVRREFEAWATKEEFSVTRNNPLGQYDDFAVEARWTVWQAALSSPAVVALVEALEIAREYALYASAEPDDLATIDAAIAYFAALTGESQHG